MNTELNLNDPAVVAELKKYDINSKPDVAPAPVKEKIKAKQKNSSFTIKLSAEELEVIQRQAADAYCDDWKAYLAASIRTGIIGAKVASPRISGPSWSEKVKGPSRNHFK